VALALFYVAMFGHMGIVLPFLAPWLERQGFGAIGIGVLMALPPLFKVLAPWCWGVWADRSGRRRELFVLATLAAGVSLSTLPLAQSVLATSAVVALYAFARAPILPYLEATTLERSEHHRFAYGPIRLWGSIAFMVVSLAYGLLRGRLSEDAGLLLAAAFLSIAAVPAVFAFPRPLDRGARPQTGSPSKAGVQGRGGLVRLLAACALMQVSHGAYYAFYSIHLQNLGYGGPVIGTLGALGVLCEVLLLARMDRVVRRFGAGRVLQASLLIAALRWLLIGSVTTIPWLALAQTLHAVTYAAFHVAAIRQVYRIFGPDARAKGQAMFSGMTYGLGMFAGSLGAGWLSARTGIATAFLASAGVAVSAMFVLGAAGRSYEGRTDRAEPSKDSPITHDSSRS
jgi:PPP family 3-phenylpropionic acid transporter